MFWFFSRKMKIKIAEHLMFEKVLLRKYLHLNYGINIAQLYTTTKMARAMYCLLKKAVPITRG